MGGFQRVDVLIREVELTSESCECITEVEPVRGDEGIAEDLADLRFCAAAVGLGLRAKCAVNVVGNIPDGQVGHDHHLRV